MNEQNEQLLKEKDEQVKHLKKALEWVRDVGYRKGSGELYEYVNAALQKHNSINEKI